MSTPIVIDRGPEAIFAVHAVRQPDPNEDRFVGSMPAQRMLLGPDGRPSVGSLGVLVDDVLGYSLIASLPPDSWTVSTEIWIDLLAPLPTDRSQIHAEARTVAPGSLATGIVADASGRTLVITRERGRPVDDSAAGLAHDTPPTQFQYTDCGMMEYLGLKAVDDDTVLLDVGPDLENPRRMLHGGISLCAAEVAATWSRSRAGSNLATSSLHVVHSRPIPSGGQVEFRAKTKHAGRSLWITEVVGRIEDKVGVLAWVSAEELSGS